MCFRARNRQKLFEVTLVDKKAASFCVVVSPRMSESVSVESVTPEIHFEQRMRKPVSVQSVTPEIEMEKTAATVSAAPAHPAKAVKVSQPKWKKKI